MRPIVSVFLIGIPSKPRGYYVLSKLWAGSNVRRNSLLFTLWPVALGIGEVASRWCQCAVESSSTCQGAFTAQKRYQAGSEGDVHQRSALAAGYGSLWGCG